LSRAEKIWDDLGQGSASQWARDAQEQVAAVRNASTAGNWDAAKYAATKLNQLCTNCHNTFRDRQDDGSFRFKSGSF
jgi:cytochrome c556